MRLITDVSGSGNLFLISKLDPLDNMTIAASTTGAGTAAEKQVGEYVERIVFDDLTVWDLTGALTLEGSSANETIYGSAFGDTILGLDGADQLYGNRGDDTLDGGTGSDTLIGGDGNDTLTGGAGDDTLNGGVGNDTHQVNRGDGQDTISESDSTLGNSDTLLYGATINPLDLVLSREANDPRLAIHGSPERVTIQNWFSTPGTAQVETIQAGNGQTLLNTQVDHKWIS